MKIKIEEVIEQTKIEPYDKSTTGWFQILNKHRNATHQTLLDALKEVYYVLSTGDDRSFNPQRIVNAIEAAAFVEVAE